jgi:hypothetical protein
VQRARRRFPSAVGNPQFSEEGRDPGVRRPTLSAARQAHGTFRLQGVGGPAKRKNLHRVALSSKRLRTLEFLHHHHDWAIRKKGKKAASFGILCVGASSAFDPAVVKLPLPICGVGTPSCQDGS